MSKKKVTTSFEGLVEAARQYKEGAIYYGEFHAQLLWNLNKVTMEDCPSLLELIAESLLDHKPERWHDK